MSARVSDKVKMGVREISGKASFDTAIRVPSLVVVDFYATW